MSNNTKAMSFWNFLEGNTIEIPIIQRDYAQGRLGKENLRKNFLADLKDALDSGKTMKLDFVYGSTEKDKMNPLDGQQRLTTLWLLHWYIALRAGELSEDNCKNFRKFAYETRISSREFCQNLCVPKYFESFEGNDIVGFITKQTWFYSAWKQDPTIQSMLRMLGGTKVTNKKKEDIVDGIEELFKCSSECSIDGKYCVFKCYWEKLTSDNAPVVFYHLSLKDFGLSDDLYIKMNARGKQLTSFESFKADLIGYITNQAEDESLDLSVRAEWKKLLAPGNGIPIKLDTDWTDIFWKNKSIGITDKESKKRKSDQIDEIYFAFLNRFFWNELFIAKKTGNSEEYILDIGKGEENSTQENENKSYRYLNNSEHPNDYDTSIAYTGFEVYKYFKGTIPIEFFKSLQSVLDGFYQYSCTINNFDNLIGCNWDKDFKFIPEYEIDPKVSSKNIITKNNSNVEILKVTHLTQVQRIVFFALCKYFKEEKGNELKPEALQRWMRVVWNLVSGEDKDGKPQIRSTSAMRTAIDFIDKLDSHAVYKSLKKKDPYTNNPSDFGSRCNEEIVKAKQILDDNDTLRLYEGVHKKNEYKTWEEIIKDAENHKFFKGAIRFLFQNAEGEVDWNDFETKWANAKEFFNDNNNVQTIELAKYCNDSQIKEIWNNYSFTDRYWKPILLEKSITEPIHRFLMKDNCINNSVLYKDINNLLPKTGTAVWLLFDWQCCKVVLTDYYQKRSEPYNGWVFEVGNVIRNQFNNIIGNIDNSEIIILPPQSKGDEKIICNYEQVYYRGLWTDIQYNNFNFRFFGDNNIYLMNNDRNGKKLKDPNAANTQENNFFFAVKEVDNKEKLSNLLDSLIAQAFPNVEKQVCERMSE